MKALTLTQPYATLVALLAKLIETRGWSTKYRGRIAIHAGQGLGPVGGPEGLVSLCYERAFYEALQPACSDTFFEPKRLPRGKIVAVADLVSVVETTTLTYGGAMSWTGPDGTPYRFVLTDQERAFGDYSHGRYGWLLANIRPLAVPVPAKGALGLWTVPPAIAQAVEAQL